MHRTTFLALPLLIGAVALPAADAVPAPALRFAHVFSDHGVLQREQPLPVWGWATAGDTITVTLADQRRSATAGADGAWKVVFDPLHPGKAVELSASDAHGGKATVTDLAIGEVWVCSGQSNMAFGLKGDLTGTEAIAAADHPDLRLLRVKDLATDKPAADTDAQWAVCTPKTVAGFSAVGYFFSRRIAPVVNVPIGLIGTYWGGTPAESWTSHAALAADPIIAHYAAFYDTAMAKYPEAKAAFDTELAKRKTQELVTSDSGWEKPGADETEWKEIKLPRFWQQLGLPLYGSMWFRTTVEIPAAKAGADLDLSLGTIGDRDITYWDGVKVGATDDKTVARTYRLTAAQAAAGVHHLVIKTTCGNRGFGGLAGKPEQLALKTTDGGVVASLAKAWKYRPSRLIAIEPNLPDGPGKSSLPTSLRNGMITPLIPYAIRGAIWYQGESNADEPVEAGEYHALFPAMIKDWRKDWGQGDFPFFFVQLANFTAPPTEPGDNPWPTVRDAQLNTLRTLPATGMASAIDVGDEKDIHPKDKKTVGERLALWALAQVYGQKDIEPSGPLFTRATVEDARIRVAFDHLGGGLVAKGGPLKQFAIAGDDHQWAWADAAIDGDTVVVSSSAVAKPVAVRYAWAKNPAGCNLYGKTGLPASPFRSDDWPVVIPPAVPPKK